MNRPSKIARLAKAAMWVKVHFAIRRKEFNLFIYEQTIKNCSLSKGSYVGNDRRYTAQFFLYRCMDKEIYGLWRRLFSFGQENIISKGKCKEYEQIRRREKFLERYQTKKR